MTDSTADRPVQIEITPEMIEAGVWRMREFSYGQSLHELVEAIYLQMEIERGLTKETRPLRPASECI